MTMIIWAFGRHMIITLMVLLGTEGALCDIGRPPIYGPMSNGTETFGTS